MIKAFFSKLFAAGKDTKSTAKSRLHFVLVQDRTGLSNEDMSCFKRELVEVIEKYFVIDKQAFDIDYKRDNEMTTLYINSPVIVRRQDAGKQSGTALGEVGARRNKYDKHNRHKKRHNLSNQTDGQAALDDTNIDDPALVTK